MKSKDQQLLEEAYENVIAEANYFYGPVNLDKVRSTEKKIREELAELKKDPEKNKRRIATLEHNLDLVLKEKAKEASKIGKKK